jgi:ArsR family transcriptional regulator
MSSQVVPVVESAPSCCVPIVEEALSPEGAADMARAFKVLADPVRLRVLSLIAARKGGEVYVCEITDAFELTGPTISYHLRQLRQAGLVDCQSDAPISRLDTPEAR